MAVPRDYKLLSRAFAYAADWHREDTRKGSEVPYIAHLLAVSALVLEFGGTDKQAAAALLHDVAEDHGGEARLKEIRRKFGKRVEKMVRECSDSLTSDPSRKKKWKKRKRRYIEGLGHAPKGAVLVACADKLHNAQSTVAEARRVGPQVWKKFTTGKAGDQVWYYREVSKVCTDRLTKEPAAAMARELAAVVDELEAEAAKAAG